MARVLIVEDDPGMAEVIRLAVATAGHQAAVLGDGQAALQALLPAAGEVVPFDVVLMDVKLPGIDGLTLLKRLRASACTLPVLLVTSRDEELDEALGLELGADDYVMKPFSIRVLLLRIEAVLRRSQTQNPRETVVEACGFVLVPERLSASFHGHSLQLTLTEFRMVEAMVKRPGVVFSRDRLIDATHDSGTTVSDRLVDTYIRRLRRKLDAVAGGTSPIETVSGMGYRLRAEVKG